MFKDLIEAAEKDVIVAAAVLLALWWLLSQFLASSTGQALAGVGAASANAGIYDPTGGALAFLYGIGATVMSSPPVPGSQFSESDISSQAGAFVAP